MQKIARAETCSPFFDCFIDNGLI